MKIDFEHIFNISPDLIFILDLENNILCANQALAERVGVLPQELNGTKCFRIMHQKDEPPAFCVCNQLLKNEPDHTYEMFIENMGGWFNISVTPLLNDDGVMEGSIHIARNNTDRKHYEKAVQIKYKELVKVNAGKDKFFSIITHDLRSPFQLLLGYTGLLVDQLPNLTSGEIQKYAVGIRNSATNFFNLLETLLEWSRIQQGTITINREAVLLLSIVNDSIVLIQESLKNKGIVITCDIQAGLYVFTDKYIIQTVIRNLLSNAMKFTPKGGKISISANPHGNKIVEISISDTGIGMSNEIVDNLFRIDVKTNRSGTDGEPSAGLGLIICKDFIDMLGGKIWVESKEGKGSVFYFTERLFVEP